MQKGLNLVEKYGFNQSFFRDKSILFSGFVNNKDKDVVV